MGLNFRNKYYLVSQDPIIAQYGNITVLHWTEFLKQLWNGEIY